MVSHQSNAIAIVNISQRLSAIVMLSMMSLLLAACPADARPEALSELSVNLEGAGPAIGVGVDVLGAPVYVTRTVDVPVQTFWHELLTTSNNIGEQALYTQLRKYQQRQQHQPNYLAKWPALRDLFLTADYADENNDGLDTVNANNANIIESNELVNSRFVERLHELAASVVDDLEDARADNQASDVLPPTATAMPLRKPAPPALANNVALKDHGIKKNVQYMSPCHFKICNMGRKRNARFFDD